MVLLVMDTPDVYGEVLLGDAGMAASAKKELELVIVEDVDLSQLNTCRI
jgi:hypothetical protein